VTLGGRRSVITAPWTPEQVAALNRYQQDGRYHPFTCGKSGSDLLVAAADGWHCLAPGCTYTQHWAHAFMAEAVPP
jgi:hypothetical protein